MKVLDDVNWDALREVGLGELIDEVDHESQAIVLAVARHLALYLLATVEVVAA